MRNIVYKISKEEAKRRLKKMKNEFLNLSDILVESCNNPDETRYLSGGIIGRFKALYNEIEEEIPNFQYNHELDIRTKEVNGEWECEIHTPYGVVSSGGFSNQEGARNCALRELKALFNSIIYRNISNDIS